METICDAVVKTYLVLINVYWKVVIPYKKWKFSFKIRIKFLYQFLSYSLHVLSAILDTATMKNCYLQAAEIYVIRV